VRWAAALLLATIPVQFAYIYRDYFSHYKRRSAFWYDPVAFRGAAEPVIAADAARELPAVYLSRELDDGGPKWRFYVTKHARPDLLQRTRYFDDPAVDLARAPVGALAIVYANPYPDAILRGGQWIVFQHVTDVDGRAASMVLKKVRE
jgi:hypothetical protein